MRQKYLLKLCTVAFIFMLPLGLMAQTIKGKITDSAGRVLPYMNIVEEGNTSNGMVSDDSGEFSITVKSLPTTIIVSSMGFATKSVKVMNSDYLTIVVLEDNALDEIVLVGSRGKPRTAFDSPVPIDNIKISELTQTGQGVLYQQLMFKVPSYNSTQQPVSDAGAHFSPADLRGLFPSRTLVLVNGKRKNASALVYS